MRDHPPPVTPLCEHSSKVEQVLAMDQGRVRFPVFALICRFSTAVVRPLGKGEVWGSIPRWVTYFSIRAGTPPPIMYNGCVG